MTDKPGKPAPRLAGVTNFGDDDADYIAPPPRAVREQARAGGEAIGFVSDRPAAPAARATVKKRPRLPSQFPDHYNLRLREGDRERFDDYAYRHRLAKGDVFALMLDLLEAKDRADQD
ncbi:hypothetical protein [Sphingomonas sp.]|uniref:hypothetical protein n=1 Tax=Sphingomonas sp. TaxID=28214 RepID=UPI000DB40D28|nr:hypothetical protein [Sphingomonas sp.]PZU05989.1 MAG: hypothetical protein DI605_20475 [Sphingomonas sp.]